MHRKWGLHSWWWLGQNHNKTPAHCRGKSRVCTSSPLQRCLFLILNGTEVQDDPYLLPRTLPFLMFSHNLTVTLFLASSFSSLPSFLISLHLSHSLALSFSLSNLLFPSAFISFSLFCACFLFSFQSCPLFLSLSLSVSSPAAALSHFRHVPCAALTTSNHRSN